jgi:hypothetical protein
VSGNPRYWGLSEFGWWLGHRLNHSTRLHWRRMIALSFPEDEEAFSKLPRLYEEFLIEVQTPAPKQDLT